MSPATEGDSAAAREAELRRLAEAHRMAGLAMWEWEIVPDRFLGSDELYRLFGVEPEAGGRTWAGFLAHVHPDDRVLMNEGLLAALEGGEAFEVETRTAARGRDRAWVQARGEVVRDDSGAPMRVWGTVQDVTRSKATEAALRETAARAQLLLATATAANQASSLEQALPAAVGQLCDALDWVAGRAWWPVGGAGSVAADRTPTLAACYGSEPGVDAILDAVDDGIDPGLSPRNRVRATAAPAWIADLHHDAPSPTTDRVPGLGVRGVLAFPVLVGGQVESVLEFFSRRPLEPDPALLETVTQVGAQLSRVAEREPARVRLPPESPEVEAGGLEAAVVDFDLAQVIEEAAGRVAEEARRKGLKLDAYCYPDVPPALRGDPVRVGQVVLGLASNAVKFTSAGEVVVRAEVADEWSDTVAIRFEVVDTGIGISETDRHRVLEPFFPGRPATTRHQRLATSRRLVAAMGGELGFDSEVGRGSTFWFMLPFRRPTTTRGPETQKVEGRGRVLVVEDNASNQMVAVGILRRLGFEADVAANGHEALDALVRTSYRAILMDCQMPMMDGYATTAELRRRQGGRGHTPVIAMTAAASERDRQRCLDAGMDDFLTKPVRVEDVKAALHRWTGNGDGERGDWRAAGPGQAGPVLDAGRLDELRQLGPPDGSFLAEVVAVFLKEGPAQIAALTAAVDAADGPAVAREAHRLKGQAASMGAIELVEPCARLEQRGRAGELDRAAVLVGEIRGLFERAADAFRLAVAPGAG